MLTMKAKLPKVTVLSTRAGDKRLISSGLRQCHIVCLSRIPLPMDAVVVDDEKKSFDAETAQDDDSQPDPEEHLMLDQGNGRIWLVKVCKSVTVVLEL